MPTSSRNRNRPRPNRLRPKQTFDAYAILRAVLLSALGGVGLLAIGIVILIAMLPRRVAAHTETNVAEYATAIPPTEENENPPPPPISVRRASDELPALRLPEPPILMPPSRESAPTKADVPAPVKPVEILAVKAAPPAAPAKQAPVVTFKRMHLRSSQDFVDQLAKAPSLMLDTSENRPESRAMIQATATNIHAGPALLERRATLAGLPIRRGASTQLAPEAIRQLATGAKDLQENTSAVALEKLFAGNRVWFNAERIAAMMQVLMVKDEASRIVLAKQLAQMKGKRPAAALVQMTLFDPAPEVRQEAMVGLRKQVATDYQPLLLQGLEYPWVAVAEHAAETLVELERIEAVPALLVMLQRPHPQAPYTKGYTTFVREVVHIDHKRNCLMCHPASVHATDALRTPVPPLNDPVAFGYAFTPTKQTTGDDVFVRADVTYLKQDYSVLILGRRVDLFVRERKATSEDAMSVQTRNSGGLTGHQAAIKFALRELTGEEAGPSAANWKRFVARELKNPRRR